MSSNVEVCGKIKENIKYSHSFLGEKFYFFKVSAKRLSGTKDIIPVIASERIGIEKIKEGDRVKIIGSLRSHNLHKENKTKLKIFVFAENMYFENVQDNDVNKIDFEGCLCKKPVFRTTPLNREIADILLASNRRYGKSDYIPCIAWGRNAKYISEFDTGCKFRFRGRVQSREYIKITQEEKRETKVAYEVSIETMEVLESEN